MAHISDEQSRKLLDDVTKTGVLKKLSPDDRDEVMGT